MNGNSTIMVRRKQSRTGEKKKSLSFLFFIIFFLACSLTNAQTGNNKIEGRVTDENGEGLPGATILEKGTNNGSITDLEGNFAISVSKNSTLIFSYIGYVNQEISVGNQNQLNVSLAPDLTNMDEVVVVGYGISKKSDLTGAVVRADIDAFRESPNTNIMQSLQGSVPGLNVGMTTTAGSSPSLSIRGLNSISGSSAPLIVLDGVIYNGNINEINPNDVESVDVLKDASSTAIYGSRAANGVLIITTKKGGKESKPVFNYSGTMTFQSPSNLLTPLDREGYIEKVRNVEWEKSFLAPDYTQPNPDYEPSFVYQTVADGYAAGTETNWLDLISQDSYIQNHNLSVSGNSNGSKYYLSTSYTDQEGYIINDSYSRWTTRINLENEISEWFTFGLNSFAAFADYSGSSPDMRTAYLLSPLVSAYNEDGSLNLYPQGPLTNPLVPLEREDLDKRMNLVGNFYGIVSIPYVKGLTYRLNFSNNYRNSRSFGFDRFAQNQLGSGFKNNGTAYDRIIDNIVNYSTQINDVHGIKATLVYGHEKRVFEGTNTSSSIFTNMDLGYNRLQDGDIERQTVSASAYEENSLYSMARAQYDYNGKYFFTGTVRRDGFSGFGKNKKTGYFPSLGLAWTATEEPFLKNTLPGLNLLKFRGSFGESGNRTVGRYGTLAKMSSGYSYVYGDGGSSVIGQTIANLENADLGWETTRGLNLGIDFAVLKQRIRGNIEYYNTQTRDILYSINLPSITGFNSINTNIGKVANWGLESSISTVNVKKSGFQWESTFNFSMNRNKVVSILGQDNDGDGKEDDLISSGLWIGKSRGIIYHYNVLGIYQLGDEDIIAGYKAGHYRIEDINGDGTISAAEDRKILGYSVPSYRFSIQNTFTYKNWTLRAFINSIQGGKQYYYGNNRPQNDGAWGGGDNIKNWNIVEEWDYWTPNNPNAEYRQLNTAGSVDPAIYRQRSFVRLQDVSLSYNVPKFLLDRLSLKGLKIYGSGKNLATWTKWKGLDPETGTGITSGGYPVLRSYTVGLNVSF
ncbi:SusC/RagA family TonB-linked outer membrane protein [Echinicola salinicaeni]|uniref:SusC/RagA family TonB-linked outer membrane protein n=1 Tax=Echinicola salinicaeni TaxID=2762757 RepID=UPI001647D1FE|nr:TonB-dependent receptor [Echinicola salinicaeni]